MSTELKTVDLSEIADVAMPSTSEIASALTPYYQRMSELQVETEGFIVSDPESLADAETLVKAIKEVQKELKRDQEDLAGPFRRLSRFIDSRFKFVRDRIDQYERSLKSQAAKYLIAEQEKEKQRIAEERRLQEEKLLELAAQQQGPEAQDAFLDVATAVPAVKPKPVAPATNTGVKTYTQERWSAEVVDADMIIKAIHEGHLPMSIVQFRPAELNKIAVERKAEGMHFGLRIIKSIEARMR